MSQSSFNAVSFIIRLVFALALVFLSYNPSGYSFYHWAQESLLGESFSFTPALLVAGLALVIGWAIYLRATFRSLGPFGLVLAIAFLGALVWWVVDQGWIGVDNVSVITYISLVLLSVVLAIGMSWSHIRRRMSGQVDIDDVDE